MARWDDDMLFCSADCIHAKINEDLSCYLWNWCTYHTGELSVQTTFRYASLEDAKRDMDKLFEEMVEND
jgi:hypothetical protein